MGEKGGDASQENAAAKADISGQLDTSEDNQPTSELAADQLPEIEEMPQLSPEEVAKKTAEAPDGHASKIAAAKEQIANGADPKKVYKECPYLAALAAKALAGTEKPAPESPENAKKLSNEEIEARVAKKMAENAAKVAKKKAAEAEPETHSNTEAVSASPTTTYQTYNYSPRPVEPEAPPQHALPSLDQVAVKAEVPEVTIPSNTPEALGLSIALDLPPAPTIIEQSQALVVEPSPITAPAESVDYAIAAAISAQNSIADEAAPSWEAESSSTKQAGSGHTEARTVNNETKTDNNARAITKQPFLEATLREHSEQYFASPAAESSDDSIDDQTSAVTTEVRETKEVTQNTQADNPATTEALPVLFAEATTPQPKVNEGVVFTRESSHTATEQQSEGWVAAPIKLSRAREYVTEILEDEELRLTLEEVIELDASPQMAEVTRSIVEALQIHDIAHITPEAYENIKQACEQLLATLGPVDEAKLEAFVRRLLTKAGQEGLDVQDTFRMLSFDGHGGDLERLKKSRRNMQRRQSIIPGWLDLLLQAA